MRHEGREKRGMRIFWMGSQIYGRMRGLWRFIKMIASLRRYEKDEIAQQRMKIITFYEEYGEKATKDAFGVSRKLIHQWRKRLKEEGGKVEALIPHSTRPKRVRASLIPHEVIEFIRELREEHPRLGKEKIKPLLDEWCEENGFSKISVSTIGNVIKRNSFFFQKSGRVYHDPGSGWAERGKEKAQKERVKSSPKVVDYGYILSDTIEKVVEGVKRYFFNAIAIKGRFAITLMYKRKSSRNMVDFYRRFKEAYPLEIKVWQNDNGSENRGEFEEELKKEGVKQVFSYPRCPRINGYVERYNRTVQEEFIDHNIDLIYDDREFNKELAEWLIFYNTRRIHKGLNNKTPVGYLIENDLMSQMSLTYTVI